MCEKLFQKKNKSVQSKIDQAESSPEEITPTPEPVNEPATVARVNSFYQRMGRLIRQMAAGSQCSSSIRRSH